MNTNHTLIHIWDSYLRVIDINDINQYNSDFLTIYGNNTDQTNTQKILYNTSKYYKRLNIELEYKKFKYFHLVKQFDNIWKIHIHKDIPVQKQPINPTIPPNIKDVLKLINDKANPNYIPPLDKNEQDYVIQEITTFFRKKIVQYKEDDENTLLDDIKAIDFFDYNKYISYTYDININRSTCQLKHLIDHPQGKLLTIKHLAAAFFFVIFGNTSHFTDDKDQQDQSQHMLILTDDGPILNISDPAKLADINLKKLIKEIGFTDEDILNGSQKYFNAYHTGNYMNSDPKPFDPYENVFNTKFAYLDVDLNKTFLSCNYEFVNKQDQDNEADKKIKTFIYKNNITKTSFVSQKSLDEFKELEKMTNMITSTTFGKSILDLVATTTLTRDEIDDLEIIMDSLKSILQNDSDNPNLISTLTSSTAINSTTSALINPALATTNTDFQNHLEAIYNQALLKNTTDSIQSNYTKLYVDKYKDDTCETSANEVITNINEYLLRLMKSENINKNKISKDLVNFGVKKLRKSHGFIYGIKQPLIDDELIRSIKTNDRNTRLF